MHTLIIVIHVIVCFLMIAAILLQGGKGAEIGAAFGGSSQTVFGSRGPTNFLSKVTIAAAVIFMLTSLSLAYFAKQDTFGTSVIDSETEATVPVAEESKPAGDTAEPTTTKPSEPAPAASETKAEDPPAEHSSGDH